MMSKEKDKLLVSAQKLAQRGQIDKAIKEYQAALQLDKKDVKTLLRLGDLYAKSRKNDDAMKCYAEAAKLYTRDGFYSKAIAIYKRVLELDENRDDIYLLMADLYQRLGMIGDAMTQYQRISSNYEKDGKIKEALDIYRNMAELDPRNILILTKLAELNYKSNNPKEGYTIFKRALDELKEQNRFEEYTRLMEKLARADPENVENLKELCAVYIKRKVYDRAYPFLVKVCQAAPDDLQSLSNLAELCIKLGKKDEAVIKLKELASANQKKGLRQKAQEALNRIAEIEGKPPAKAAQPAAAEKTKAEEVVELAEEVGEVKEMEVEAGVEELNEAAEEEAVIETRDLKEAAPAAISTDKIQENLTEADVYFKYGLRDKALGHIQLVLQTDPKNIQALKRLKNIMLDAKNQDAALDALRKIALYADKERDWANLAEASAEILKMVSGDAPAQAWLKKADAELSKSPAPAAKPAPHAEKAEEPEVIEEEVVVAEEEPAKPKEMPPKAPVPPRAPAKTVAAKPAAKAAPAPGFKEEIEEAEFYVQQGLEEEGLRVYLEILQTDPSHKQAMRRVKELEAVVKSKAPTPATVAKPPVAIEEEVPVVVEEGEVAEEVIEEEAPVAAAPPEPSGPQIEVPAEMKEAEPPAAEEPSVEFEGPPASAEEEEEIIITRAEQPLSFKPPAPGQPAPAQPAAPVPKPAAPTPISMAPTPPPPVVDETAGLFDLAAELEKEDLGPAPTSLKAMSTSEKYSFEDMFRSFKDGVSKVVSENDAATHYDLGIAYKEMGLAEDGVREFQTALKAGHSPGDCYLMIGICYAERGKFEQAIEEYEKGVTEPRITDKEKAALFYELGQAWTGLGDFAKALKMFEKCQTLDPGVRDVAQRVDQLRARLSGAKPEMPATPSREGVSWESAALKEPGSGEGKEEEDAAKKSRKKISYV